MKMNVKDKEQLIVGTIISCNNEIKKLNGKLPISNLMERSNIYHFNMGQLLQEINPLFESFNPTIPQESIFVKNDRGNYCAYFQKVYNFLDGFEINLQKSLNENLKVDEENVDAPKQLDIFSFKSDLKEIIQKLMSIDDVSTVSKEILKIKAFAKKPLNVYGYDICNNIALKKELYEKFNILEQDLLAICYDKSEKQLLFVTENTGKLIAYSIIKDELDLYNNINDEKILVVNLTIKNYLGKLKELIHNNIMELYVNADMFDFKFTDNLYHDEKIIQTVSNQKQQMSVIKK